MVVATGYYVMMNLRSVRPASLKGKLLISITLLTLVVGVGSYSLWSKQVWSQYVPRYTTWFTAIKTDIDMVQKLPSSTTEEKAKLAADLEALDKRLASQQDEICTVTPLVGWQSRMIASGAAALDTCKEMTTNIKNFQAQLHVIVVYIRDDEVLARSLRDAPQMDELKEDAWSNQPAAWSKVLKNIQVMTPSDPFKPTQQRAVEKVTAIKTAWEALNSANQSKDKAKYTAALKTLGVSYDAMDEIALTSETRMNELSNELQTRYQNAFR
jgi:hypothetical protein